MVQTTSPCTHCAAHAQQWELQLNRLDSLLEYLDKSHTQLYAHFWTAVIKLGDLRMDMNDIKEDIEELELNQTEALNRLEDAIRKDMDQELESIRADMNQA